MDWTMLTTVMTVAMMAIGAATKIFDKYFVIVSRSDLSKLKEENGRIRDVRKMLQSD